MKVYREINCFTKWSAALRCPVDLKNTYLILYIIYYNIQNASAKTLVALLDNTITLSESVYDTFPGMFCT